MMIGLPGIHNSSSLQLDDKGAITSGGSQNISSSKQGTEEESSSKRDLKTIRSLIHQNVALTQGNQELMSWIEELEATIHAEHPDRALNRPFAEVCIL